MADDAELRGKGGRANNGESWVCELWKKRQPGMCCGALPWPWGGTGPEDEDEAEEGER